MRALGGWCASARELFAIEEILRSARRLAPSDIDISPSAGVGVENAPAGRPGALVQPLAR
jgi:hypothetical protein